MTVKMLFLWVFVVIRMSLGGTFAVGPLVQVGGAPGRALITPNGAEVYVTNTGNHSVSVISTSSNAVTGSVSLSGTPSSLAVSPDGAKVYVGTNAGVSIITTSSKAVVTIPTAGPVRELTITPNGAKVFLALEFSGLWQLLTATNVLSQVSSAVCPEGVSVTPNGATLYVNYQCGGPSGSSGHDAIGVFDAITNSFQKSITGQPNVGENTSISPNGAQFWENGGDACSAPYDRVGCPANPGVPESVINIFSTSSNTLIRSIGGVGGYMSFTPDSSRVFLVSGSVVQVVNTTTFAVAETIAIAGSGSVVFTPDGSRAYAPVPSQGAVAVLSIAQLTISGPASLPIGILNQAYPSTTMTVSGGTGAMNWSASGLPSSLSIGGSTGIISGTPTIAAGSPFTVTIKVTDAASLTATRSYSLTITTSSSGIVISAGNGSAAPGQFVEVPIQVTTQAGNLPVGFQADASFDQQKLSYVSSRIGEQLTSAGKSLSSLVQANSDVRFLGIGFNQNTISNGTIAYVTFKLSNQFPTGTAATVTLKNCQCTGADSLPLPTTCAAGTITSGCTCDANGDSSVNVSDVQFIINQALTGVPSVCHSGGVNVSDVQRVINAVLGLGCSSL